MSDYRRNSFQFDFSGQRCLPWLHLQKANFLGVKSEPLSQSSSSAAISDDELVKRAMQGEVSAFEQLVGRYEQRVHAVALGVLGNFDDAQDVAQEAFLKAFRNISSFRGQSSFYTWMYRITFNLAIDERRKRYRHVENSIGESAVLDAAVESRSPDLTGATAAVAQPDAEMERMQLRSEIEKAIAELSPDHRTVIMLREVEGLSYSEISNVVGCSKGTVMSRLHHARRRLKKVLSGAISLTPQHEQEEGAFFVK